MKKLFWIGCLFLAACNSNVNNKTAETDSVVEENEVSEEAGVAQVLQSSFPHLFGFFSQQDNSFSATNFTLSEDGTIDSLPTAPLSKSQLQPFYPYLKYNSDSSLAVDLYSYNYIITHKNGKAKWENAGPDTEVALVDFKNNKRKRIFFGGPSTAILDAKWLNDNELLLAGADEVNSQSVVPKVWKLTLPTRRLELFTYSDTLKATISQYVQTRVSVAP